MTKMAASNWPGVAMHTRSSGSRKATARVGLALTLTLLAPIVTAAPQLAGLQAGLAQWQRGTVADMDAAERALYAALEDWGGQPLDGASKALLEQMSALPVRATTAHPEVPALRVPAWPVAQRARTLLLEDRWRLTREHSAKVLAADPGGWLAELRASPEPAVWLAALKQPGNRMPSALRSALAACAPDEARCAEALLSAGTDLSPAEVLQLCERVPTAALLRWVQSLDATVPAQRALLLAVRTQVGSGALVSAKLAAADRSDAFSELGDPERGAAVAAALAERLDAVLLDQLAARYATSRSVLEQQRLLLVLRLNGSARARAASQTWLDSPATLAATRQAVQSW